MLNKIAVTRTIPDTAAGDSTGQHATNPGSHWRGLARTGLLVPISDGAVRPCQTHGTAARRAAPARGVFGLLSAALDLGGTAASPQVRPDVPGIAGEDNVCIVRNKREMSVDDVYLSCRCAQCTDGA